MRRRVFAWAYARQDRGTRYGTNELRAELLGDLAGEVLEIGCGPGSNFAFYPAAAHVTAVDDNVHMRPLARRAAAEAAASITVERADALALPHPDARFDAVVATLVLCSVPDLPRALAEARRVLRPGGALRLFEHVRSERPWVARLQHVLSPAWGALVDGCHLDRDTGAAVRAAGFTVERETSARAWTRAFPLPAIVVRARR